MLHRRCTTSTGPRASAGRRSPAISHRTRRGRTRATSATATTGAGRIDARPTPIPTIGVTTAAVCHLPVDNEGKPAGSVCRVRLSSATGAGMWPTSRSITLTAVPTHPGRASPRHRVPEQCAFRRPAAMSAAASTVWPAALRRTGSVGGVDGTLGAWLDNPATLEPSLAEVLPTDVGRKPLPPADVRPRSPSSRPRAWRRGPGWRPRRASRPPSRSAAAWSTW